MAALGAIRAEKIRDAKAVAAIAAAKVLLAKCYLAADLIPAPGNVDAAVECLTWHTLKMAGIIAAYNAKVDAIWDAYQESYGRIQVESLAREKNIEAQKSRSERIENVRHDFQMGLIRTDLKHCITRVNND